MTPLLRSDDSQSLVALRQINVDCLPGIALFHFESIWDEGARLDGAARPQPAPNMVGDLWCRYHEGVVNALSCQQPYRVA